MNKEHMIVTMPKNILTPIFTKMNEVDGWEVINWNYRKIQSYFLYRSNPL